MAFILGVVLFAIGIAATIALHEVGHMVVARACGMRVRRYFVGFGPTIFSFTRGHTTYGMKAIPFGGFCDIAGMTAQDTVTEEEKPYAMWAKPAWQRICVLAGGIAMNLLLGFVVIFVVAVTSGLPNPHADMTATVAATSCPSPKQISATEFAPCTGTSPAAEAGIEPGDKILAVNGAKMATFVDVARAIRKLPGKTAALTVKRNGNVLSITVPVEPVVRLVDDGHGKPVPTTIGVIGVTSARIDVMKKYDPISAVGASLEFSGKMLGSTVSGLVAFPAKLPGVFESIFGGHRDEASPMSVVGATRIGGELASHSQWAVFGLMLASLNFFLALFNVVPLPPLDGGHIAVVIYEKLRNAIRRLVGRQALGPADYTKLMPLTYTVSILLIVVGLVVFAADIVNPITLGG